MIVLMMYTACSNESSHMCETADAIIKKTEQSSDLINSVYYHAD